MTALLAAAPSTAAAAARTAGTSDQATSRGGATPEDPDLLPPHAVEDPPVPPGPPPDELQTPPVAPSPQAPPAPAPITAGSPPEPQAPTPEEDTWVDVGHAFVEQRLFAPILRFDRFFSDERALEAERARSFVRFRQGLRFRDDGTPTYTIDVAANLRFPALNRSLERVRLVIAAQTEEAVNAILPEGPTSSLRGGVGRADAGVRFGAWEGRHSSLDLGAGLLARLPVGTFGRIRYRASIPVRRLLLLRFTTSGFWRSDTLFGTDAEAAVEHPFGSATIARLSGASTLTERSRGIEWSALVGAARTLSPRSALAAGVGLEGAERSEVSVDRYRLFTRYRRDVFRHWIYGELEPEIAWPWSADRGRFRELALTVRLEIQFHGNEPPVPPPVALREPADPPEGLAGPR